MKRSLMILICGLVLLTGCGSDSGYKTGATWADSSNYMFAVEVESFDGDIFEAGTYSFYPDGVSDDPSKTPVVWDVYVSTTEHSSSSELTEDEHVATVGGMVEDSATIELQSGDYVYINYNQTLGDPTGMLKIEKK